MRLIGHRAAISCVRFAPDGRTLVSTSTDGEVRLWKAWQSEHPGPLSGGSSYAYQALAFEDGGARLVARHADGYHYRWDVRERKELGRFGPMLKEAAAYCAAKGLLVYHSNKTAHLWDARQDRLLRTISFGQTDADLQFSPSGRWIAGTFGDWMNYDGRVLETVSGEEQFRSKERVMSFAFSPDERCLAMGLNNGGIQFWDTSRRTLRGLAFGQSHFGFIGFAPDGRRFVAHRADPGQTPGPCLS